MNKYKKIFLLVVCIIIFFLLLCLIYFWNNKSKVLNKDFFDRKGDNISHLNLTDIPPNSEIICLTKETFPKRLNFLDSSNLDADTMQKIFKYLKQNFIDEDKFDYYSDSSVIKLNIKSGLKFENDEPINAQTLKFTLQTYIDNNLAKNFFEILDNNLLSSYITSYLPLDKQKKIDNLISIDSQFPLVISLKLKPHISPQQAIISLNKLILIPPTYIANKSYKDIKILYGSKQLPLLSYGEYKINFFDYTNPTKLVLSKREMNDTPLKYENNTAHIVYLNVINEKDKLQLFLDHKINYFKPVNNLDDQHYFYDNQQLYKELLNSHKYEIKFDLENDKLFLGFNLKTKENYLKYKIKEQLGYFLTYFHKQNNNNNNISDINYFLEQIDSYDILNLEQKYKELLSNIWVSDKEMLHKSKTNLSKWFSCKLPHIICYDENFRKAIYFAIDRQQIINNFLPFYKADCYPISELSEFHYKKTSFLNDFLNFLHSTDNIDDPIKNSYNKEKAKKFFDLAWNKLPLCEQEKPIKLQIQFDFQNKIMQTIFDFLNKNIKDIFSNKVIFEAKPITLNSINVLEDINDPSKNIVDVIEIYNNTDLYIESFSTFDCNTLMLHFLTKFNCNYFFEINFQQQINSITDNLQKQNLTNKFKYALEDFNGINAEGYLKGNVEQLYAFFINKLKNNSSLNPEINKKMQEILINNLVQKYFEVLPTIPLFAIQNCTIKNK
ncbi:MAG: hypothetical protein ACN23H_01085 [Candidatus Phytoplasma vitis]|nr:MAG: ABC transporter substrate-binding protein [Candidatus Phytoplasma vitis]